MTILTDMPNASITEAPQTCSSPDAPVLLWEWPQTIQSANPSVTVMFKSIQVSIPAFNNGNRAQWLFTNADAYHDVCEGIEQAKRGEVKSIGSFAEFADEEIDD
jgi:hypothetical protein